MPNHLPPELSIKLHELLLECSQFNSLSSLSAIFVDGRISAWGNKLPTGDNKTDRVAKVINFLWGVQSYPAKENGLVLLLEVLSDHFDTQDLLHTQLKALTAELRQAILQPTETEANCPYRGLEAFQAEHADMFFGREEFVQLLVEKVQSRPLTAVIGASGSGKSSVVFAGLIPALEQAKERWLIATFRPAKAPFLALAQALLPLYTPNLDETDRLIQLPKLTTALQTSKLSLAQIWQEILKLHPKHYILLIIDQFEELFTQTSPTESQQFLDILAQQFTAPAPRPALTTGEGWREGLKVVLTLRADFLGQALNHPAFTQVLQNADVKLGAMTVAQLSRAIEKPAEFYNVTFEPGLVERLLKDVGGVQPTEEKPLELPSGGNLPLLEFALTQLWTRQSHHTLTFAAYEAIGGVTGALSQYADEVYQQLSPQAKEQTRRVFMNLISPGAGTEDTRRVATQAELEKNWDVVPHLASSRLLVTNRHTTNLAEIVTVEVVHEALIRHWKELRGWLNQDRDFVVWKESLNVNLKQWQESNHDKGALLRGANLTIAQEKLSQRTADLNQAQHHFIEASLAEHTRQTRWRNISIVGLVVIALLMSALAFYGYDQSTQANQNLTVANQQAATATYALGEIQIQATSVAQQKATSIAAESTAIAEKNRANIQAQLSRSRELAAQANELTAQQNYPVALSLAIEAMHITDTLHASNAMYQAQARLGKLKFTFSRVGEANGAIWNKAGSHFLIWNANNMVWVIDGQTGQELFHLTHDDHVNGARWSQDESHLLTWSDDKTIRLWDASNGSEVRRFTHGGVVKGISWSQDESRLLTWSDDKTVRLWDVGNGSEVRRFTHGSYVNGASWSQDESRLLTWGDDNIARLWDTTSGVELRRFAHEGHVNGARWSQDENRLLTWSGDKTIRLWNSTSGAELHRFTHNSYVNGARWSQDESRLLTWGDDNIARLWDTTSGVEVRRFTHDGVVKGTSWSQDESHLLTWSGDHTVRLWNVGNGAEVRRFTHDDVIRGVSWSKNESWLLTWSRDKTVRLWDVGNGAEVRRFTHDGVVKGTSWNKDESRLLTWSDDKTVRLWDTTSGAEVRRFTHDDIVWETRWSQDESHLLTWSDDNTVRLWDIVSGLEICRFIHDSYVNGASWNKDESHLLTWSDDKTVRLWDTTSGVELRRFTHDDIVWGASWNKDESRLLTWSDDKTVRLWDTTNGVELRRFTHDDIVWGASWNKDESRLLTWSDDKTVRLWDTTNGVELRRFTHDGVVKGTSWNKDESRLLTWSDDKTVRLWDTTSGAEVRRFTHDDIVWETRWSQDESHLLTWSDDNTVRLWDIVSGLEICRFIHDSYVNGASWNKDESRLLTWSDDKTVRLWDTTSGVELRRFTHDDIVWGASWNKDESRLLTWSDDKTVRLWDTTNGVELRRFTHDDIVNGASWNKDESRLLTWSDDKTVRLWPITQKKLMMEVCQHLIRNLTQAEWQLYFDEERYHKTCDNLPAHSSAIDYLVREGAKLVGQNQPELAKTKFQQAQTLAPDMTIATLVSQGKALAYQGEITQAITLFEQANTFSPTTVTDANSWNSLCWQGSLQHQAQAVMFACEQAVKLAPDDGVIRDSRGLARALIGDYKGAIEDFEFFVKHGTNSNISQHEAWINGLKAGRNPFTPDVLAKLREE